MNIYTIPIHIQTISEISHKISIFSKNNRFNGTNWITFKILVTMTTEIRRAIKYLNSSIKDPTTLKNQPHHPNQPT